MSEIRSKAEFYRLWRAGVLGNRTLLWDTGIEALAYHPELPIFGFREIRRSGTAGAGAWRHVLRHEILDVEQEWKRLGRQFIIDGSVPSGHTTAQGEVCRTERGLESYLCVRDIIFNRLVEEAWKSNTLYNLPKEIGWNGYGLPPMRRTFELGWHEHRGYLETKRIVDRYMDPSSRDDLDALLELYPDATIEFSCFDIDVGVIPGRNTIFWETRNY